MHPQSTTIFASSTDSTGTAFLYSRATKKYPDTYRILLSRDDWERVSAYRWAPFQTEEDQRNGRTYFVSRVPLPGGRYQRVYLHRFIMNAPRGIIVDHRDSSNTRDNRRSNLRFATNEQNSQNARKKRNNSGEKAVSRYKGVCRGRNGWKVRIQVNGKRMTVGTFRADQETQAARAYDVAALEHHGEFALTSFPACDYLQAAA